MCIEKENTYSILLLFVAIHKPCFGYGEQRQQEQFTTATWLWSFEPDVHILYILTITVYGGHHLKVSWKYKCWWSVHRYRKYVFHSAGVYCNPQTLLWLRWTETTRAVYYCKLDYVPSSWMSTDSNYMSVRWAPS